MITERRHDVIKYSYETWVRYKEGYWSIRKHCKKGSLLGQYDSEVIDVCRTEFCTKSTKEKGIG